MNGFAPSWGTPAMHALAWALVHFLWQGALLGLVAAALLRTLRRAEATTRYALAAGLLGLLALLPVGTALRLARSTAEASAVPLLPAGSAKTSALPALSVGAEPYAFAVGPAALTGSSLLEAWVPRVAPALPYALAAWLLGVLVLGAAHLGGWLRLLRWIRQAQPLDSDVEERLLGLARRLGVGRRVRLLESTAVLVPAVVGWLRPAILVPASALAGLSPWQLDAVLAHELAHVRRHDYLVNLLQAAVETFLFYHPVVWWLSSEVRRERENCCDDLAVGLCGDRLSYARTLADLEGLRDVPRGLALAADGGSLMERVRRLVGAPASRSRRSWLVGLLVLALVPAVFAFRWAGADSSRSSWIEMESAPDDSAAAPGTAPAKSAVDGRGAEVKKVDGAASMQGTWVAERDGDQVQLESTIAWKSESGRHRWQNSDSYAVRDLAGLTTGPEVRFELRRDSGRFLYTGTFHGDRGKGTFTFQADPGYVREMAALGYELDDWGALTMATHDVSLAFVHEIHSLGYKNSSLDTLVSFRIHGVNPGLIREYAALGLTSVPAEGLVSLQIHEVTPDFVRGLGQAGYHNLDPETLVQFKIHGVSVEQVRGLEQAGLQGLSPDELVQLQIHNISATTVQGLIDAGLPKPSVDELVQLSIHEVTPQMVRGLKEAGLAGLSAEELVQLRIHGVDGSFVRSALSRYGKLSAEEVVELKIRGRLD